MKNLVDMTSGEFLQILSDNYITKKDLEDFVKKSDIKDFVTRGELQSIVEKSAKEAGDHSTRKIEESVTKSVQGVLVSVGINPNEPHEMQKIMYSLKEIIEQRKEDKKTIRGTVVKTLADGVIVLALSGFVIYIAKALNFIK